MRANVDLLNIIQLGVTLFDAQGNTPRGICTWQFNFKFNIEYVDGFWDVQQIFVFLIMFTTKTEQIFLQLNP